MEKLGLIEKIVETYFNNQDDIKTDIFKTEKNNSESYNVTVTENKSNKIHLFNIWMEYNAYLDQYRIRIKITKNNKLLIEEYIVPTKIDDKAENTIQRISNLIFNEKLIFANKKSSYEIADSLINNRTYFESFSDIRKEYGYDEKSNKLNISLILKRKERMEQIFIEIIAKYDETVDLKITSKNNMHERSYYKVKKEDWFNYIISIINTIL